ncbi:cytochrome P450 [Monoraphidium neglectum]|uniref:Cytochrome P450 n=1 Tax=Monoraphidium neglectum TaxID=145388 RepID=A0A0D2NRI4_9CHLO|nr:cytochrome P450 [Monoraphidium neglectum]KIZ06916.1 cytochrome P450 [Monoraphidium neglectum]|eukprot:XP_013905935.1 cytochrome P450 [Monoraphidium neglectum]
MIDLHEAAAVGLAVFSLATILLWTTNRWKLRRIPGFHEYLDMCRRQYGRVFKIYLGSGAFIVVADPHLARKVNYRLIDRSIGSQLSADKKGSDNDGLLGLAAAKGEEWRQLRMAWQPAFASGSLAHYSSLMDSCAVRLCDTLEGAAKEGREVDIFRALGTMTMGVVGTTAFGIDFHTLDDPDSPSAEEGLRLVKASQTVFSSSSLVAGTFYQPLLLMFPKAVPFVQWLASTLPDRKLVQLSEARKIIRNVGYSLIQNWRSAHPDQAATGADKAAPPAVAKVEATLEELQGEAPGLLVQAATHAGAPEAAADANGFVNGVGAVEAANGDDATSAARDQDGAAAAAAQPQDKPRPRGATDVEPGSFLGLLLRARDRASGAAKFSDASITAQASTFILAGYETTANALSYAVYNIALSPRVQERLHAEIDAFGRTRQASTCAAEGPRTHPAPVTHADLGEFPYAEAVVKEALRLYPPATLTSRVVTKQEGMTLIPGVTLKKGANLFTAPYCYQRDEAYWPRPLEFAPERFLPEGSALAPSTDDAWTPFGAGPRMCIGWRFALNEAKIALVRLHQRFSFELRPGQVPLKLRQGITLSPADGVWVRPIARGRGVEPVSVPPAAAA